MSSKFSCLVVEDEAFVNKVLCDYVTEYPRLELAGNAFELNSAKSVLSTREIDIIILDMNVSGEEGITLLDHLYETLPQSKQPVVIFSTAHTTYAIKSFNYNVAYYLLKPYGKQQFYEAIDKALEKIELQRSYYKDGMNSISEVELIVNSKPKTFQFEEILYTQSLGNYVKIFTVEGMFLASVTTQKLNELLPDSKFIRIHKSSIVNISKVDKFTGYTILIDDTELPVGISYKLDVTRAFSSKSTD